MNDTVRGSGVKAVCRHCGMPVAGVLYTRDGNDYCCEGCFLSARNHALHDDPTAMLVEALATALDAREHETGLHSKRVACHTLVLAKRFTADAEQLRQIYWGALLHDIGKIGVPDAILLKPAPLTPEEWQVMRQHPEIGHRIVAGIPLMAQAAEIVLSHEERYDGSGYPRGLARDAIPLGARLFAVIDTLDAVTSDRPYRRGRSFDEARVEIERMAGTQFDPSAVDAFVAENATLREMVELKCDMEVVPNPVRV